MERVGSSFAGFTGVLHTQGQGCHDPLSPSKSHEHRSRPQESCTWRSTPTGGGLVGCMRTLLIGNEWGRSGSLGPHKDATSEANIQSDPF